MTPNVEVLRLQTVAFDGVVRSVTGGEAMLVPSQFYAGERDRTGRGAGPRP